MHVRRSAPTHGLLLLAGLCTLAMFMAPAGHAETLADTTVSFATPARSAFVESAHDSVVRTAAVPVAVVVLTPGTMPPTLLQIGPWLDYKVRYQVPALPDEARLFYRRGLMAHQSGAVDQGIQLVRGASQLDPAFTLPYFTLGAWFLMREPGQALAHFASLLEVARQSFAFQLALEANTLYTVVEALLLGLIAVGIMIVVARNSELRHRWRERFGRFLSPRRATFWSWVVLVVPFAVGFGPALPTVLLLGLLWPVLKWMERSMFVLLIAGLVAMPWFVSQLDRLGSPLREDREPLYGVLHLQNEAYAPSSSDRLATLAREHPDNAFIHFGRAWMARRGNDLATAEAGYRRTLELWPNDDRVLNNLGNVLSLLGRTDEALDAYDRAAASNPFNAATHYNRARIYTDRFEFRAASEAMARAAALNFDMLKPYQTQVGTRDALPPADLWIAPGRFWNALARYQPARGEELSLPPLWRSRIECLGWPFSLAVVLCAGLGITIGILQHRAMPLRSCGNCARVVCRRCAERRREVALCHGCAAAESGAAPEYAGRVLTQHSRIVRRRGRAVRTALAALVPGFGWVLHRRVFEAWFLITMVLILASIAFDVATPFSYEPRLSSLDAALPGLYMVVPWIALYVISLLGYFIEAERERVRFEALASASTRRVRPARYTTSRAA